MSNRPKAIDLFCGAGGISEGLKQAGFDVIWATDHDEKCISTHRANHEETRTVKEDITELDPASDVKLEPEEVDVVAGGPPCPTFSLVGRSKINSIDGRNNGEDARHQLYKDFLKFVEYFQPEAFIMENVEGMESAKNRDGEPVVDIIEDEMRDLGYWVNSQVVDAADYGVPQHRKRIIFIGSREEQSLPDLKEWESHRPPETPEEKMIKPKDNPRRRTQGRLSEFSESEDNFPVFEKDRDTKLPYNTVADAILDLPPVYPRRTNGPSLDKAYSEVKGYPVPALSQYQQWVRDLPEEAELYDHRVLDQEELEELEERLSEEGYTFNHESRGHNIRDLTLYKMLGEGTGYKIGDLPDDFQPYRKDIFSDNYKKQNPKKPSSTVVAHISKDGHMFIHPNEARSLTPREAARLQSFKDSYIFPESRTSTYRQIGNAVPPLLAQAIGTAVREELLGDPVE